MAGHSKWKQIKHRKEGADAKRGALFSKLARMISVAARDGDANPDTNPRLRQAMEHARSSGLPKDNIERAVQRAASASDIANLKSVEYEAYGPGGAALLASGLTDNSNRTTNEVKKILSDHGGRLAEGGSVAWMFDKKILIVFPLKNTSAENIELELIDAGADDTASDEDGIEAIVSPDVLQGFLERTRTKNLTPNEQRFVAVPKTTVTLEASDQEKIQALTNALEDHDDINEVWTNVR